jgi:hypothetical protein
MFVFCPGGSECKRISVTSELLLVMWLTQPSRVFAPVASARACWDLSNTDGSGEEDWRDWIRVSSWYSAYSKLGHGGATLLSVGYVRKEMFLQVAGVIQCGIGPTEDCLNLVYDHLYWRKEKVTHSLSMGNVDRILLRISYLESYCFVVECFRLNNRKCYHAWWELSMTYFNCKHF